MPRWTAISTSIDMDDGSAIRDPIFMGMIFKGSGALDPRGYPLLYLGGGLGSRGQDPRMYVVSLITGKIIYQYGNSDDFAHRDWDSFDSCPLVDAETDTLIWVAENGILYTIKLNTQYDKGAGTITAEPSAKEEITRIFHENKGRYG